SWFINSLRNNTLSKRDFSSCESLSAGSAASRSPTYERTCSSDRRHSSSPSHPGKSGISARISSIALIARAYDAAIRKARRSVTGPGEPPDEANQKRALENADRLMARVRARDAAAFESLYDSYHRLVYGVAFRIVADVTTAEDVTQAVFLKIWT